MLIKKFLAALLGDWVALMSGGASIILTYLATYLTLDTAANRNLLWVASVACFVFAAYRIWLKEHKRANEIESLNQAQFTFYFETIVLVALPDKTYIFILCRISNSGADSFAHNWELYIQPKGSAGIKADTYAIRENEPIILQSETDFYRFTPNNALYNQTLAKITKGEIKTGVLPFVTDTVSADICSDPETTYHLSVQDAWGKTHPIKQTVRQLRSGKKFMAGFQVISKKPLNPK